MAISNRPGTYILLLEARRPHRITVGCLGPLRVRPGWYLYVGSACGPGGLAARLAHHCRPSVRPRWHIDYLRAVTRLQEVWYACGRRSREQRWARRLAGWPEAEIPLEGFGASDSRLPAHLFYFPIRPAFERLEQVALAREDRLERVSAGELLSQCQTWRTSRLL